MTWWRANSRAAEYSRAAESMVPRGRPSTRCGPRPLPAGRQGKTRTVVVAGVDGTRSGRVALLVAAEHAAALGADLVGVHVRPALPWLWSASPELIARAPQWQQDVEAVAFFDTAAAAERVGVGWFFALAEGDVATSLRREAENRVAALVVVAARAEHRGRHRCPARRLAETCERPVIVVDAHVCSTVEDTR
jgi:nucleotide-binding universal stress UspA family protein